MKKYLDINVYEAAKKRITIAFELFDNVLVALSGGKDSGVCVNLCYEIAKERGLQHKLAVYHEDYEGGYPQTFDFIERTFEYMNDIRRYWICLPIRAACSASMHQTSWIPWDDDKRHLWIRRMPNKNYVVNQNNVWFDFEKGTSGFELRKIFAQNFAKRFGSTAVIVGLRAQESLSRHSIITSKRRTSEFKGLRYTKIEPNNTVNFYPIYDWNTRDIWIANAKFNWDYNKLYDLYYQSGVALSEMRTASPFHSAGQKQLKLYKIICPNTWSKMVNRVNGVNFTAIYGGTIAMGWRKIKKPDHFTWKEYAHFLIKTLPKEAKEKLIYHLERLNQTWSEEGYGRNPKVIAQMKREGIKLEKTGEDDPRCIKEGFYEIVKIKNGFPDETKVKDFRHCPNWKDVCIAIMKNDYSFQTLGRSRTKKENARRKEIMNKYKNIL